MQTVGWSDSDPLVQIRGVPNILERLSRDDERTHGVNPMI